MSKIWSDRDLDVPLPGGRGLPGEGEGVARLPRIKDHVIARVLAANDRRSWPIILSHKPGLEIITDMMFDAMSTVC